MAASGKLAGWALGLRLADIPRPVRDAVGRHVMDALGCGLAARRTGLALPSLSVAAALGGPEEATVIGGGRLASPNAALANGVLMHALDFDDTHAEALVHVTTAVLPAALAVAEERDAGGEEFLLALVAGMEVAIRLGLAVRHGFHSHGFHASGVCGAFASTLAAARLMSLDEKTTENALGIAGSFASGSLEFLADGTSTKQIHPGWAAHGGILAARLAAAGATGPATILEGGNGLFRSYTGQTVDAERITGTLGRTWETGRITIKPYPACQLSHASLDALRETGVRADEVESVTLLVPADSVPIVCEPAATKLVPRTAYEAKFSLQWCAATLLVDGRLGIDSFEPGRLARPEVLDLATRIAYLSDDTGLAAAAAGGKAEVRLRNGSTRNGEVSVSRGGPERPLTLDQLMEKFRLNAAGYEEVAQMTLDIPSLARVRDLGRALGAAVRAS